MELTIFVRCNALIMWLKMKEIIPILIITKGNVKLKLVLRRLLWKSVPVLDLKRYKKIMQVQGEKKNGL